MIYKYINECMNVCNEWMNELFLPLNYTKMAVWIFINYTLINLVVGIILYYLFWINKLIFKILNGFFEIITKNALKINYLTQKIHFKTVNFFRSYPFYDPQTDQCNTNFSQNIFSIQSLREMLICQLTTGASGINSFYTLTEITLSFLFKYQSVDSTTPRNHTN